MIILALTAVILCVPRYASAKPNIIVFYSDDHGYADLSCQGILKDVRTPHIDSLAASGVRMTSGYSTAAQCVPSRAGLLSGQYQNKIGVEQNKDPLDGFNQALTIAERLKKAGYVTGMTGKWHLGLSANITSHGFDDVYYKSSESPGWTNFDLEGKDVKPGTPAKDMYHLDANSAATSAFIKRHHKSPFFFYCAYRAPHVPLDPPSKYLDRFSGKMPERRRKALAMISAMDDGVGDVIETLRQYEIEEKTLIFFIGDNGAPLKIHKEDAPGIGPGWDGSLNDPLNGEKGTVIEGGARVPFVVSWKGTIPGGQVYDHPVIALDVAATAVALAGLGEVAELDGVNLLPYLTGKNKNAPHDALFWKWRGQSAIRKGQWKFISAYDREYLYDLEADIGEKKNLLQTHPEIASELKHRLSTWVEKNTQKSASGNEGREYFDFYLHGKTPDPAKSKRTGEKKKRKAK
jgi:uncharacterized sulfatase